MEEYYWLKIREPNDKRAIMDIYFEKGEFEELLRTVKTLESRSHYRYEYLITYV